MPCRTVLGLSLVVAVLASPGATRERTPATAQAFLAEAFNAAPVKVETRGSGVLWLDAPQLSPRNVRSTEPCRTQYDIAADNQVHAFNWATISLVERDGARITVRSGVRYTFADARMATRVTFAMDFLRLSCDASHGDGF